MSGVWLMLGGGLGGMLAALAWLAWARHVRRRRTGIRLHLRPAAQSRRSRRWEY